MKERSWVERDLNEAFFPVGQRPVYVPSSIVPDDYRPLERYSAVMDLERDRAFSVVTDDYHLVTNRQAFERAQEVMQKVFQVTRMDDLACLNIVMPKTRSFCHIDLIHRSADFEPWERDKWIAFLRITNSYNRTRRLRYELGFCRWICLNGMIFGAKSIEFSYAHTRRGINSSRGFENNIGDIRELEAGLTEKLHQLKRYHVPSEHMLSLACRTFNIGISNEIDPNSRQADQLRTFRTRIADLTETYFSEMGAHGYSALNVLTDYASNPVGVVAPESRIHGFQQRASNWMEEFVQAIQLSTFSFEGYLGDYREIGRKIQALA